jgi:hypothetical protein
MAVFPAFFAQGASFSTISIGVFSEVFLESKNGLHGNASFSRRIRGFFSRVFADGLFLMFISSQGI